MKKKIAALAPAAALLTAGCADVDDHDHSHSHSHGLATSVVLHLSPTDGGEALSFAWSDPEGDGDPVIDSILLPDGSDEPDHAGREYALDIEVLNELEDPVEDVTAEIEDEGEAHQFFFTGSAVQGPATGDNADALVEHAYADEDVDGLPLGLSNTLTTLAHGERELTLTLRHLPPEDDQATKTEGLAEDVAEGGFAAIPGENDIEITFPIEVE